MDKEESISIDETNKLRLAAGLKPLNLNNPENTAQQNYEQNREKQLKNTLDLMNIKNIERFVYY